MADLRTGPAAGVATFAPYQEPPDEVRAGGQSPSPYYQASTRAETNPYPANERANVYETSLPIRLDIEAALAYVFPPASAILLLIFELNNNYVRFHAWQSALLFSGMTVLHIIFSFSTFLSWVLLITDIGMISGLAYYAYQNTDSLERYHVPFVGAIASEWVDSE